MEKLTNFIFSIAGIACVLLVAIFAPGAFLRVILVISGITSDVDTETHNAIMFTSSFVMLVIIVIGVAINFEKFTKKEKQCDCSKKIG